MHIERGRLSIACVCMVLGFMLAIQFRSTRDIKDSLPQQRVEEMTNQLQQLKEENEKLHADLEDLQNSNPNSQTIKLSKDMRTISGLTALEGPGVIVTIDDSTQSVKKDGDPNLYLVHDEDILKVINELKAAGAEAISINGQRLIATSEIRCAGPTLSVNNVRSAPPFEIRAIGSSKDLAASITMRGGVSDTLKVWGIKVSVKEEDKVYIPAHKQTAQFKYATVSSKQEDDAK